MSRAEITIDTTDFRKAAEALERAGFERQAGRTTAWALRRIVNLIRKNVRLELKPHRVTGKMRDRVRVRFHGVGLKATAGVRSTGSQSNLIAGGVRPHRIEHPRMPLWGKSAVQGFASVVEHPGFAADPFFHRGYRRSIPEINAIAKKSAETMAKELAYRMRGRK